MDQQFLAEADRFLGEYLHKIGTCVALLDGDQLWWRPNAACNSVGNLLLHLRGNLSQWVLDAIGGEKIERHRSEEFAARESATAEAMMGGLTDVVGRVRQTIGAMRPADLARRMVVQGYETDGLGVVFHVVEHMSYHTGQIVDRTKELLGPAAGIEFYPQHRGE